MGAVLYLVEYIQQNDEKQVTSIFLDAFDNLNWSFLFKVLEELNYAENFIHGIKSIYTVHPSKA